MGRSQHHAFAYFIIPGRAALSEASRRRLRALQEFSELGSGFRLAAADLEIRGAGEFLGSRQHGHIAALGFDLYAQMLERTVREYQGEVVVDRPPVALHLGVDIKVPESFMPDVGDRLALYKRLATAREDNDVDRLQADAEDRNGHLPPSARNLFDMTRLRLVAEPGCIPRWMTNWSGSAAISAVQVLSRRRHVRSSSASPLHCSRPCCCAHAAQWRKPSAPAV